MCRISESVNLADQTTEKMVTLDASPQAQPPGGAEKIWTDLRGVWTSRKTLNVPRDHVALVTIALQRFQSDLDGALPVIQERYGTNLVSMGLAGLGAPCAVQ